MKKKLVLGLILCLGFGYGSYVLSYIVANESCLAFAASAPTIGVAAVQSEDPCETLDGDGGTAGIMMRRPTLGFLIASGGAVFLDSSGQYTQFVSLYELSEISRPNYKAMTKYLAAAVEAMEKATRAYDQLSGMAREIPYNQGVINRLAEFDYEAFQESRGLIPSIFLDVQAYLSTGDVRGVYAEFHLRAGAILDALQKIKASVDGERLPEVSAVWRLNQKYASLKLFGQYVAEVFISFRR